MSAMIVGAVAPAVLIGGPVATESAAAAVPVESCVAVEPFTWFGQSIVEPGTSLTVGSLTAAEQGVRIRATATDTSPAVVPIFIGGAPVVIGTAIVGGDVSIVNGGTTSVEVSSIAIGLDRCRDVAVLATPADVVVVPTPADVVLPTPVVVELPPTGRMSRRVAASAALATLVGAALLVASRRRIRPTD